MGSLITNTIEIWKFEIANPIWRIYFEIFGHNKRRKNNELKILLTNLSKSVTTGFEGH